MPQIQIPDFEAHNQQYARDRQNALMQQSHLKTAALQQNALGMQNQNMAKEMQDRQELEGLLMSTPPEQRDRVGLEFLKARDPEKAAKLQATFINRFAQKARLDPKNAAMELENATGEKIELGNRYSKLPIEGGEAYIDNFTGHVFQPNSAAELAAVKNDFATKLEAQKQEGRKDLETLKASLKPDKSMTMTPHTVEAGGRVKQFNPDTQRYDIDVGPAPPKSSNIPTVTVITKDDNGNPITRVIPKAEAIKLSQGGQGIERAPAAMTLNRIVAAKNSMNMGNEVLRYLENPAVKAGLGPALGRVTGWRNLIGNPPPELAELSGMLKSWSELQPAVHGMRSSEMAEDIERSVGPHLTPEALAGFIRGFQKTARTVAESENRPGLPNRRLGDAGWNDSKEARYQELLRKRGGQ